MYRIEMDTSAKTTVILQAIQAAGIAPENVCVRGNNDGHVKIEMRNESDETVIRDAIGGILPGTVTDAERMNQALENITQVKSVALRFADDIAQLFAAVIQADAAGDTADERYTRIRQVVVNADQPFQDRFGKALESETGINIQGLSLGVSLTNKRSINAFTRRFANSLGMLLTL